MGSGLGFGLEQALSTRSSFAPRRRYAQPLSPHAAPGSGEGWGRVRVRVRVSVRVRVRVRVRV